MEMDKAIVIAKNANLEPISLNLSMANRHGLIAGATGTGKTVTLQKLAESFSSVGVSVFSADVKGDLAGIAFPAQPNAKIEKRLQELKVEDFKPTSSPVIFWDLLGQNGHPIRTTVTEFGPLLLARLLDLNNVQQGILNSVFKIAADKQLLLSTLQDLRDLLEWTNIHATKLQVTYGNLNTTSIGTITRNIIALAERGGENFFGQPEFAIEHLFKTTADGKGVINILDSRQIINDTLLYSTFLLWLLTELFDKLPEVGDLPQPKLVFFFDEAHLLFNDVPKPLLEKILQLVRLVRSKGIGVFFVTQSPLDIPDNILGQLGNRIQHSLRAFTVKDLKGVKASAQTFRANKNLDTEKILTELAVGEALVSLLDATGTPNIVERVKIIPPESRIGVISDAERRSIILASPYYGLYENKKPQQSSSILKNEMEKDEVNGEESNDEDANKVKRKPGRPRQSVAQAVLTSTARSFGTQMGRQFIRSLMSILFGKK